MGLLLILLVICLSVADPNSTLISLVTNCMLRDRSTWVSAFSLQTIPGKGLAVRASRDMMAGEVVTELPYSLHVNSEFASRMVSTHFSDPQIGIAVCLASQRHQKLPQPSFWSRIWPWSPSISFFPDFVDLMPSHVSNAAYWSDDDFALAKSYWGGLKPVHNLTLVWSEIVEKKVNLTKVNWHVLFCFLCWVDHVSSVA